MALATVASRYTVVLGPVKCEIVNCSATADTNTISSLLATPKFAFGVVNTDALAQTVALNCAVSGKTITINQASLSAAETTVFIFGH